MTEGPDEAVLVCLRVAGSLQPEGLADRIGAPVARVEGVLGRLCEAGLVQHRLAAPAGWSLTQEGRTAAEAVMARRLDGSGRRQRLEELYEAFRRLNGDLLEACTRWQLREVDGVQVVNDHTEADHDAAAVAALAEVHSAVGPILAELEAVPLGFDGYGRRFERAMDAVRSGDRPWFASPLVDSYHSVWFELHEHLLASLGLRRADEQPPASEPASQMPPSPRADTRRDTNPLPGTTDTGENP